MSLFQNHLQSLSELERLAELTRLPHLLPQIGAAEWPLAMLACCLHHGVDEDRETHVREVYRVFQTQCPAAQRVQGLAVLSSFLSQQKGRAWRALLAYALEDEALPIRREAANLIVTLAPEDEDVTHAAQRLLGLRCLTDRLIAEPSAPTTLLDALMATADRRVSPHLDRLLDELPEEQIIRHLGSISAPPSQLYFDWLCLVLARYPETCRELVVACFIRTMTGHDEVVDNVLPMPRWKYRQPAPLPLHQWTRREYADRMEHALSPYFDETALAALKTAFIQA